jgi:photosystem II stability/assembly factor-like uncharacterized protein
MAMMPLLTLGPLFGAGWTPINAGLPSSFFGITALTVDPSAPSTLYATTPGGSLFKSTDAAASWKAVGGVVGLSFLAIDPTNSSTIYAATQHGIVKSTDGGEKWNAAKRNPANNCFMLVIDPVTPTTVYGLSYGQIFKTIDGGETWNQIHASTNSAGSLVIDPTTPSTMYASVNNADIIKSTDGGENWVTIKTGLSFSPFSTSALPLVIDPRAPSTLYAGSFAASSVSTSPGVPPIDFGTGSISKSADGGQTWTTVRTGIPSEAFVRSLALDPASPSTIYAAYSSADAGGILKSADGGQSWTVIDTGAFPNAWIAVDPETPSILYAAYADLSAGSGTISKSTDAGSSWTSSNEGLAYPDLHVLAIDPVSPATVYTAGAGGVFKSDDAGGNWINLAAFRFSSLIPSAATVRSVLIDSKRPNILYAETLRVNGCVFNDKTVFKSTDGGATWSDDISPPDSGCILGGYQAYSTLMAMDPVDPEILYLGETEDEDGIYALLKSIDGGASWTSIWNYTNALQSGLNTLAIDPVTPTTLYAGVGDAGFNVTPGSIGTGVFKSTDGGVSWSVTALNGAAVTALTIDPTDPSILYAVTQGIYTKPSGFRGLFKSTDGGASWVAINCGLTSLARIGATITSVVIVPNDSNIVYAATSGDGIYRSVDGGGNWVRFNDGLTNLNIRALAIVPGTPTTLYAATAGGVFAAVDDASQTVNLHAIRQGVH